MATDFEKLAKDIYVAIHAHDLDKVLSFHVDDVFFEIPAGGRVMHGKEESRDSLNAYFVAFSNFKMELTSFFASGNRCWEEWVVSGMHTGAFQGFPATGKSFSLRGISARETKGGKTSRVTAYYDSATMMRQLGV
jgi:steroid delta-isomerase-like uncharacterized protein